MTRKLNKDNRLQDWNTKHQAVTCGIFYCRDSAEINGSGSLQTSSWLDIDVLRNRQQKHTAVRYGSLNKTTDTTEQIVWWLESLKILSLYSCCWYSFYLQLLNLSIITNNLNAKLRMRSTFMNTMRSVLFVVLNSLFFHQAIKISYYQKNNL